jgi:thymidylate kinase
MNMNMIRNTSGSGAGARDRENVAERFVPRPFLITFSGIDGAGKTTQIELLSSYLQEQNLRVLRLSFWDDVAFGSKMRANVGDRTVDANPANRVSDPAAERSVAPKNNKHIRKWYLTVARSAFYVLDAARLRRLLAGLTADGPDVVIFDRYIYDQLANIYSRSAPAQAYRRFLLKRVPTPDLAFIIDASPAAAFARKPEYPLEFMQRNRENFLQLREFAPELIAISGASVEEVTNQISLHVSRSRLGVPYRRHETPEPSRVSTVVPAQTSRKVQNQPTANV